MEFIYERKENIAEKGKKVGQKNRLRTFLKGFSVIIIKICDCVVKIKLFITYLRKNGFESIAGKGENTAKTFSPFYAPALIDWRHIILLVSICLSVHLSIC